MKTMDPKFLPVIFLISSNLNSFIRSEESVDDTIALLKCEIEELKRNYEDVKTENLQLREKFERLEKEKVEKLMIQNSQQDAMIAETIKQTSHLSSRCKLLTPDVCGNCTCVDDHGSDDKYFCDCQSLPSKRDCAEHYSAGCRISGVYRIHSNHLRNMQVYCDHETDGGGWTVLQRRVDKSTNFYRGWKSYKEGFGTPQGNLWLGLENIYALVVQAIYPKGSELRIDMQHWAKGHLYAKYSTFRLDGESTNYTMYNGGFSGNTEDMLAYHNALPFATYDHGMNDCPTAVRSAWWFGHCSTSDFNAEYVLRDDPMPAQWRGITWGGWTNIAQLKYTDMKVRRSV